MNESNRPLAPGPTPCAQRIASLDSLRGFALLGILTINIVAMGLPSDCLFDPRIGPGGSHASVLDQSVWMAVDVLFEGAFRALFSMLFGAGIVLFTTGDRAKSGRLHYRRTFWLFVIGLVDAYLLLWHGDILMVYAIAGAMLYWLRNLSARWLYTLACGLLLALMLFNGASSYGLRLAEDAHRIVDTTPPAQVTPEQKELSEVWSEFHDDLVSGPEETAREVAALKDSYITAFRWNAPHITEQFAFLIPVILLWDAVLMMLIGMAMFKSGVLSGLKPATFYLSLAVAGFSLGLTVNSYEVWRAYSAKFEFLDTFTQLSITYDLGRLGMALGYTGLVIWWCKGDTFPKFKQQLSAVGRMALTNYLMHSVIALFLFTGAGFALFDKLTRWQLYPVVIVVWSFQLWFSSWWLSRRRFGPVEELWRRLTYGRQ